MASPGVGAAGRAPQIQQLQQLLGQNPEALQSFIQQLSTQNPEAAQLLANNPEALLQLLGGDGDGDGDGEGEGENPHEHVISVTPEERDAIDRVCSHQYIGL